MRELETGSAGEAGERPPSPRAERLAPAGQAAPPKGFLPKGFLPKGFLPKGFLPKGFLPKGFLPKAAMPVVTAPGTPHSPNLPRGVRTPAQRLALCALTA